MKTLNSLALVLAFAASTLAAPISESTNDLATDHTEYPSDANIDSTNSTSYSSLGESRKQLEYTYVTFCTGIERRGKCKTIKNNPNYKCRNLYDPYTHSVSSIEMYIMSKCKFYKSFGCKDRSGFKQLEVDKKNGMWTWNMEAYGMDNKVRSFMCFDYDA